MTDTTYHDLDTLAARVEGTIEYDAAGNLIDDKDGYRYTYDYENRIVKIEKPDGAGGWSDIAMFEYDALGMRIAKYDAVAGGARLGREL